MSSFDHIVEIIDPFRFDEKRSKSAATTKRHKLKQLDVPSKDVQYQLTSVAKNIFDIDQPDEIFPADDSSLWTKTDTIYQQAKSAYDDIVEPFHSQPEVYKFKASKDRKKKNKKHEKNQPIFPSSTRQLDELIEKRNDPLLTNIGKMSELDEELAEDELHSFLNPFALPSPWVKKKDYDGKYVYYNTVNRQKRPEQPIEMWDYKLSLLKKLKLNESCTSWVYSEDDSERRRRIRILMEYDEKLRKEIARRESKPTPREQVEDVLFLVVEEVCSRHRDEERRRREEREAEVRRHWHPATMGRKMARLGVFQIAPAHENARHLLTDHEYLSANISNAGLVTVPIKRNPNLGLYTKKSTWRERLQAAASSEIKLLELMQSRLGMQMSKLSHVKDIIRLPTIPIPNNMLRLERKEDFDPDAHTDDLNESNANKVYQVSDYKPSNTAVSTDQGLTLRESSVTKKKFMDWPVDSVMVTLTVLVTPPPLYIKRKPTPKEIQQALAEEKLRKEEQDGWKTSVTRPGLADVRNRVMARLKDAQTFGVQSAAVTGYLKRMTLARKKPLSPEEDDRFNTKLSDHAPVEEERKEEPKDVFDTSIRQEFELNLLSELAAACCIPQHLIAIEEIRRLPLNDPDAIKLKKRKVKAYVRHKNMIEAKRKKEIEDMAWIQEHAKRNSPNRRRSTDRKSDDDSSLTTQRVGDGGTNRQPTDVLPAAMDPISNEQPQSAPQSLDAPPSPLRTEANPVVNPVKKLDSLAVSATGEEAEAGHWLVKDIRELNEHERQEKRIHNLQKHSQNLREDRTYLTKMRSRLLKDSNKKGNQRPISVIDLSRILPDSKKAIKKSDAKEGETAIVENVAVVACEISLTLRVDEDLRTAQDGLLKDLRASDVAALLQKQVLAPDSPLAEGDITRHVVGVRWKDMISNKTFDIWEEYWKHILSPVFFGYKVGHYERGGSPKNRLRPDTLPSGVHFENPAKKLTDGAKLTLREYGGAASIGKPYVDGDLIDLDEEIGMPMHERKAYRDNAGKRGEKIRILRPDLRHLTEYDLLKLKNVYKALKDRHDRAVSQGLVDGERMNPIQFATLKDTATAYRIYKNAEAHFHREKRHQAHMELMTGEPMTITKVSKEMYEAWTDEIRKEEIETIQKKRQLAAELRLVNRAEADLRRTDHISRSWMWDFLIKANTEIKGLEAGIKLIVKEKEAELSQKEGKNPSAAETADFSSEVFRKDNDEMRAIRFEMSLRTQVLDEEKHTKTFFTTLLAFSNMLADLNVAADEHGNTDSDSLKPIQRADGLKAIKKSVLLRFVSAAKLLVTEKNRYDSRGRYGAHGGQAVIDAALLSIKDVEVIRPLSWVRTLWRVKEVEACLQDFPTAETDSVTSPELLQFVRLLTVVEPLFSLAKAMMIRLNKSEIDFETSDPDLIAKQIELLNEREKQAAIDAATALLKRQHDPAAEAAELEQRRRSQAMEEEALRRKEAADLAKHRQELREMERLLSHRHIFIQETKSSELYCVVCMQRRQERMWHDMDLAEKEFIASFPEKLEEFLTTRVQDLKLQVEKAHLKRIAHDQIRKRSLFKRKKSPSIPLEVFEAMDTVIEEVINLNPIDESANKPLKCVQISGLSTTLPDGRKLEMPSHHKPPDTNTTEDQEGEVDGGIGMDHQQSQEESILPVIHKVKVQKHEKFEEIAETFSNKIQIRVWDTESGKRGDFLGRVLLEKYDLLDPPKGTRAFKLKADPDPSLKRIGKQPIAVRGAISLRITVLRHHKRKIERPVDDSNEEEGNVKEATFLLVPSVWRIQITGAKGLPCGNPLMKTNPFCEVLWSGELPVDGNIVTSEEWAEVGCTSLKTSTTDPHWPREDRSAIMDLPPVWCDSSVTFRGVQGLMSRPEGWVSRNHLPTSTPAATPTTSSLPKTEDTSALDTLIVTADTGTNQTRRKESEVPSNEFKSGDGSARPRKISTDVTPIPPKAAIDASDMIPEVVVVKDTDNANQTPVSPDVEPERPLTSSKRKKLSRNSTGRAFKTSSLLAVQLWKRARGKLSTLKMFKDSGSGYIQEDFQMKYDALRLLLIAREEERRLLAKEDRRMLVLRLEEKLAKLATKIDQQRSFAKDFAMFQQSIQHSPTVLARCDFVFAEMLGGGGMKVMVQDPASKQRLTLMLIPILYPEDELELQRHVQVLIGRQHPSLLRVVESSVHMARTFVYNGMPAIDQRMAVVILENPTDAPHLPIIEHIRRHPMLHFESSSYEKKPFDDDDLLYVLAQMSGALASLHKHGILHRNIHSNCLLVRERNPSAKTQEPLVVKLGDYWCFENPRKLNCEYSYGRGDWGCRETAPPELATGTGITDKSDVWAMGVCAFFWATGGTYPDKPFYHDCQSRGVEAIRSRLPLIWGEWLLSVLFMCLQTDPNHRASAERIHKEISRNISNKKRVSKKIGDRK